MPYDTFSCFQSHNLVEKVMVSCRYAAVYMVMIINKEPKVMICSSAFAGVYIVDKNNFLGKSEDNKLHGMLFSNASVVRNCTHTVYDLHIERNC